MKDILSKISEGYLKNRYPVNMFLFMSFGILVIQLAFAGHFDNLKLKTTNIFTEEDYVLVPDPIIEPPVIEVPEIPPQVVLETEMVEDATTVLDRTTAEGDFICLVLVPAHLGYTTEVFNFAEKNNCDVVDTPHVRSYMFCHKALDICQVIDDLIL